GVMSPPVVAERQPAVGDRLAEPRLLPEKLQWLKSVSRAQVNAPGVGRTEFLFSVVIRETGIQIPNRPHVEEVVVRIGRVLRDIHAPVVSIRVIRNLLNDDKVCNTLLVHDPLIARAEVFRVSHYIRLLVAGYVLFFRENQPPWHTAGRRPVLVRNT